MRPVKGQWPADRTSALPALGVLLVAVGVNANTLWNGLVFDDLQNIVQNPWIRDPKLLSEIFGSHMGGFNPQFAPWYYRPLIHIAHMLVYQLAGLSPPAFHLFNVLLHAGNSVLAYLVSLELIKEGRPAAGGAQLAAFVVGLLFAMHPVHSESVAWVSGVSDLAYTAFLLGAFLLYIRGQQGGIIRFWLSGALFFAATLCKEPGLALLPLVVVCEVVFRRRGASGTWSAFMGRLLPLAVATGLYFVLRIHALGGFAPGRRPHPYDPLALILSGLDLFAKYVYTLILPVDLAALHVFRPVSHALDPRTLAGFAVVAGLTTASWLFRRDPVAVVGLAFLVLPLVPALYVPAVGEGAFAERYLYLPVLGFAILITLGGWAMIARWPRSAAGVGALLILLVLAYGVGSVSRNRVWRDSLSLWSDTARKVPNSAVAQEYLCFAEYDVGRFQEALQSCRRALELDEGRIDARTNLATALSVLGDLDGSIREFQEVLRRKPNSSEALTNLGLVYMAKGRPDLAVDSYRRALRANPFHAEAHNNLGVALTMTGQREEGIAELSAAVRLAPDNWEYASNLAAAMAGSGAPPAGRQAPLAK